MAEVFDRQLHQPRYATVSEDDRHADREAPQEPPLQPGDAVHQTPRSGHRPRKQESPGLVFAHDAVDEQRGRERHRQRQHGQQHPARDGMRQPARSAAQPLRETLPQVGRGASGPELRAALELQGNPRESGLELLGGELATARRRIVQIEPLPVESLQDQEVVEFPEQNHRQRHLPEPLHLHAPAGALEAVVLGRPLQPGGGGSVPPDFAGAP